MKCVGLQVCRDRVKIENRRSRRYVEQNGPLPLLWSRDPNHVSTAVQPVAYLLPRLRNSRSAQCCFDTKLSNSPLVNLKSPIRASNSTKSAYKFTATCKWNFPSRLLRLIHTYHAVPLPCPSYAMSGHFTHAVLRPCHALTLPCVFVKVRVVTGKIRTTSPNSF